MGKRKKRRKAQAYRGKAAQAQKRKRNRNSWILAVVIGALVAGGIYMLAGPRQQKGVTAGNSRSTAGVVQASGKPYRFRETRPTLSPALFVGRVAEAYRIAKETPEVLDQLYCYCRCAENFGHKSLLSCYADRHAST